MERIPNVDESAAQALHRKSLANTSMGRRSSRVIIEIPVEVKGQTISGSAFHEETRTRVVNAHGTLLSLTAQLDANCPVTLRNKSTNTEVSCRVIYHKDAGKAGPEFGFEFLVPQPIFWNITFPPDDWTAADRKKSERGTPVG